MEALDQNKSKWHDIKGWNYYFLLKFALLWNGYLNFHPFLNLVFLAFLLFPCSSVLLHRCRRWVAIPVGFVLFYHDTWLPGFNSIKSQGSNLFSFSPSYLLELLNHAINWQMIGLAFVLFVAYLYLSQWIRITVFTVLALTWLNILIIPKSEVPLFPERKKDVLTSTPVIAASTRQGQELTSNLPPTDDNLNAYLNQFYEQQKTLHTAFPNALPEDSVPFDLILIQICSLGWTDIDAAQLRAHPLWNDFDILFDQFNSAASYSGPAAIRLLRASCGQTTHTELYHPVPQACYILDNLATLGFSPELMLDHNASFGSFLKELREYGGLAKVPMLSRVGIKPDLVEFDGNLLSNDGDLLNRWMKQQSQASNQRNATYFNEISLHDGNTYIGDSTTAPYKPRAQELFDQTRHFFKALEQSGRKTVVIFIPEHGANLVGDKLQMPGLRDIPTPAVTHVPVGIKLIGMNSKSKNSQIQINHSSSYLAVSEFISRIVDGKIFNQDYAHLEKVTKDLPQTPWVASNDGVTVMKYQGKFYILLNGDSHWVPYPE